MSHPLVGGDRAARHRRAARSSSRTSGGGETILVTSGDGLHDVDVTALLGHHRRTGALATLARQAGRRPVGLRRRRSSTATRASAASRRSRRRDEARSDLANCGVYVIEPELLDRIPAGTFYDFGEDVWPALVAAGEPIYAYTTMAYWNDVGGLDELRNSILDAVRGRVRIDDPGRGDRARRLGGGRLRRSTRRRPIEGPVVLGRERRHRGGRPDPRPGGDRRGLPGRQGRGDPQRGAPARQRRPGRGHRHRGHLRRRLEARREHPALPGDARVLTTRHVVTGSTRSRH